MHDLAGFKGEGGYGRIQGDYATTRSNRDTGVGLCKLEDQAVKVGSLY